MSSTSPPHDPARVGTKESDSERFLRLAAEWKDQSKYLSNSCR